MISFLNKLLPEFFAQNEEKREDESGAELQNQEESESGVEMQDEGEAGPQGQNVQEGEVFEFLKLPGRDIYFVFTTRPWTGEEAMDWFLWDIVVPAVIKSKVEYWELHGETEEEAREHNSNILLDGSHENVSVIKRRRKELDKLCVHISKTAGAQSCTQANEDGATSFRDMKELERRSREKEGGIRRDQWVGDLVRQWVSRKKLRFKPGTDVKFKHTGQWQYRCPIQTHRSMAVLGEFLQPSPQPRRVGVFRCEGAGWVSEGRKMPSGGAPNAAPPP